MHGTNLAGLSTAERINFLETIALWFPNETPLVSQSAELLRRYREAWSRRNTREGYLFLKKFEREINKGWDRIVEPFRLLLHQSGGLEITLAVEAGLLQSHRFDSPLNRIMVDSTRDEFIREYVSIVGATVSNQETYPLFDNSTANLIGAGIAARVIPVSEQAVIHGKEVSLAADLFARLPIFSGATMGEILDIRTELDRSLCKFRSAMITFSDGIKNASWDKQFTADAEKVFRRDVSPAIFDLEEQAKSNTIVSKFLRELSNRSFQVGTAITGSATASALIARMSNLPVAQIATLAVPVITIGGVGYKAFDEYKSEERTIQQNNLFFYFRAGQLLHDGAYEYIKH